MNEQQGVPKDGRASGDEVDSEVETRRLPPGALLFRKRRWLRTAMLCLGVFAAGTCLGALLAFEVVRHGARRGFKDPDSIAAHMLSHMRTDLDLTEEQASRILPILQSHYRKIREMIMKEHDKMFEEMERHLVEEQIAVHRKIVEERRACFFKRGEEAGGK